MIVAIMVCPLGKLESASAIKGSAHPGLALPNKFFSKTLRSMPPATADISPNNQYQCRFQSKTPPISANRMLTVAVDASAVTKCIPIAKRGVG